MNSLNSILLEGALISDPVEKTTEKNVTICSFTISSQRVFKKEEEMIKEVSQFDVEVYSTLAENCLVHLKKDRGVRVVGRLKQLKSTDVDDHTISKVIIIAEHIEFKPVTKSIK